jgi:hypothetical protein
MRDFFTAGLTSPTRLVPLFAVTVALAGCGGGGGGSSNDSSCPGGFIVCSGTGTDTTTTTSPTVTVSVIGSDGATTMTLPSSGSVTVNALIKTAAGAVVPAGTLVVFTTDSNLGIFSPASGSALTNAAGVASIKMSAASLSAAGAATLTATATIGDVSVRGSTTFQVGAANLSLSGLTVSPSSIPAYGTSIVSVTVNVNGAPSTAPLTVSLTSGCVIGGKATLPVAVQTVNGQATATYTDKGCNATDTITVSVLDQSRQGTITVAGPQAANIQFASASPGTIALKGTAGLVDVSTVTFKVVDATGNAVPSANVDFYLSNWTGGIKLDDKSQAEVDALTATGGRVRKQTAADGTVSVAVQAGSNPASVWVLAKLKDSTLETQSSKLVISTGLPTQDRFSLSVGTHNIEGWSYDGVQTALNILAFDRVGNPVPNGSTINFVTEGAGVSPSPGVCSIVDAACTVQFVSGERRPQSESVGVCLDGSGNRVTHANAGAIANTCVYSGRVTVLAYANGEESFADTNGNNLYDSLTETHRPLGDAFVDNNEDGIWTSPEQFFPFQATGANANPTQSCPVGDVGYATAKSKANTCNSNWGQAQVRRDQVVVLSGSYVANVYKVSDNSYVPPSSTTLYVGDTFGGATGGSCVSTFTMRISDVNNNPLPAGTRIEVDDNGVQYMQVAGTDLSKVEARISGDTVLDTTVPGGTIHGVTLRGSKCATIPSGVLTLKATSPKGLVSYLPVRVNDAQDITAAGFSVVGASANVVSVTNNRPVVLINDAGFDVAGGTCSASFDLSITDTGGVLPTTAQWNSGLFGVLEDNLVRYEITVPLSPITTLAASAALSFPPSGSVRTHRVSLQGPGCTASTVTTNGSVSLRVPTTTGRLATIPVTVRRAP